MANVSNFGAAGDGKADDTEALQHALAAGDGVLRLNKGTYRITRPLVFDLTKQGYGAVRGEAGTSRIVMAGAGPAIRFVGDHQGTAQPESVKPHTWERERFPIITDVEILGKHPEAIGIQLQKTMQATISRVLIRNCQHGVHLVERNRNFLLADSHIYDNHEYGVFFDDCNLHQMIICGNHISYNKKAGIRSYKGDIHNLQITGNDIEYNNRPSDDKSPNGEPTGAEIWFEAPTGKISEVTIASNTIQATVQPGGANIRIWGGPTKPLANAVLIAITGNVIGSQTRGIELRHVSRVTITGNTLYDGDDLSLLATDCTGIAIGTNTICWRGLDTDPRRDGIRLEDCDASTITGLVAHRLGAGTPKEGAGITLVRCRDTAVSECQITDPFVRGIELRDCQRCRISDNSIADRRETHLMQQAIRVTGNSRDNLVQNNLVSGAVQSLIDVPDSTATVQGNVEA
jgi:nitrous oxidase accessory protein NosD